jgi:tripartite-type tricarboxylate transporter receptor subunit TctC
MMRGARLFVWAAMAVLTGIGIGASARAADIDPATYFKGKTITMVVDFKPGGGTDVQARYFAARFGKFIPGEPRIVVTNLFPIPAGRNFVWNAKPDGLSISFLAAADVGPELIDPTAQFQSDKFEYIGSHTARDLILYVRNTVPYATLHESQGGKVPITIALPISQPEDLSGIGLATALLSLWFDAPLKITPIAQTGSSDTLLMLERGDINGWVGGAQWYVLPKLRPGWLKSGYLKPIADMGNPDTEPHANAEMSLPLPNAITWLNDDQKKIWRALVISQVLTGKALATSPNTPPAVVKILRDAYVAALKDPDFVAGVEKIQQEPIAIIPGDKLQEMVETSLAEFKDGLPEYKALQKQIFERYVKGL